MFVVITMYDDMAMAQNPAETSCFAREDLSGARAHAMLHPAAAFTQPLFSEASFQAFYLGVVGNTPARRCGRPPSVPFRTDLLPLPDPSLPSADSLGLIHFLSQLCASFRTAHGKPVSPTRPGCMGTWLASSARCNFMGNCETAIAQTLEALR